MTAARLHPGAPILAVGGREHDLQLWDITTGTKIFQARNVANDHLDRRMPVWITGMQFIPRQCATACGKGADDDEKAAVVAAVNDITTQAGGKSRPLGKAAAEARMVSPEVAKTYTPKRYKVDPFSLVVITAYRQVRIYDCCVSPRPLRSVPYGDARLTCVEVSRGGQWVFVGDGLGSVRRLELSDGSLRQTGGYHGLAGSATSISLHPTKTYMAVSSLDRCVYVFDIEKRLRLRRLYLKQRQQATLWRSPSEPVDDELEPEPERDRSIRKTGMADIKAAKIVGPEPGRKPAAAAGAGAGGDVSDDDDVWQELERRRKLADAASDSEDEEEDDDGEGSEEEEGEEDDDASEGEEESDDDDEAEDGDESSSSEELSADESADEEEEEDGDSSDSLFAFDDADSDDSDEESDEGEDEDDEDSDESTGKPGKRPAKKAKPTVDSDEEAEALVDSAAAAKSLKQVVSRSKRSAVRDAARAKAQKGTPGRGGAQAARRRK